MLRILAVIAVFMLTETIVTPPAKARGGACYDAQKCNAECQRASNVGKSCTKMCDHQQATLPPCK